MDAFRRLVEQVFEGACAGGTQGLHRLDFHRNGLQVRIEHVEEVRIIGGGQRAHHRRFLRGQQRGDLCILVAIDVRGFHGGGFEIILVGFDQGPCLGVDIEQKHLVLAGVVIGIVAGDHAHSVTCAGDVLNQSSVFAAPQVSAI